MGATPIPNLFPRAWLSYGSLEHRVNEFRALREKFAKPFLDAIRIVIELPMPAADEALKIRHRVDGAA